MKGSTVAVISLNAVRSVELSAGHNSESAADVKKKCMLNLASCFLQLKDYKACVSECSEVLKTDPDNMKAYYRRGQALLALKSHGAAVADLKKAVERCSTCYLALTIYVCHVLINAADPALTDSLDDDQSPRA